MNISHKIDDELVSAVWKQVKIKLHDHDKVIEEMTDETFLEEATVWDELTQQSVTQTIFTIRESLYGNWGIK